MSPPTTIQRHPLDFDALQKGDVITVEQQEQIFRVSRADTKFALLSLGLAERISRELADRNRPVTIRNDHGSLVICTDAEATEHNERLFESGLRRARRAHRRNLNVDRAELTEDECRAHDRRLEVHGKMLAVALRARRQLALAAAKRTTPALAKPADGNGKQETPKQ